MLFGSAQTRSGGTAGGGAVAQPPNSNATAPAQQNSQIGPAPHALSTTFSQSSSLLRKIS